MIKLVKKVNLKMLYTSTLKTELFFFLPLPFVIIYIYIYYDISMSFQRLGNLTVWFINLSYKIAKK